MARESSAGDFLFSLLLAALCNIFLPCFAQGEESLPAIEYVYPDQSVWTTKIDAQGILDNPLLHLAESIFNNFHLKWSAKPYPANRMFERLEDGTSNFSMLVQASRLKESCIFSKAPVVSTELRVYRTVGSSPISRKEDLKGKKVITIRGYSYGAIGKYLKNAANSIVTFEAPLHESAFEMLANGRAEYLLDYTGPSEEILAERSIPGVVNDVLEKLGVFLVLSKTYPDYQRMMDSLEQVAQTIDVRQWGLDRP
jgi:polar amino acid transport system substrate-binding protein